MKIHSNPNFPCDIKYETQRADKHTISCSQSFIAELQARNARELERLRGESKNEAATFDRTHTHTIRIQTGPPVYMDPEDQSRHVHFIELQNMP
ncbi:MAG: hypothetical protein FWD99_02135 [Oscillospiraceae bacterium]|nr:hypothetical protein [Oscillospiraceae bacterium]